MPQRADIPLPLPTYDDDNDDDDNDDDDNDDNDDVDNDDDENLKLKRIEIFDFRFVVLESGHKIRVSFKTNETGNMYFKLFEAGADSKRELKISSAADVPEHLSNFVKAEVKARRKNSFEIDVVSTEFKALRLEGFRPFIVTRSDEKELKNAV